MLTLDGLGRTGVAGLLLAFAEVVEAILHGMVRHRGQGYRAGRRSRPFEGARPPIRSGVIGAVAVAVHREVIVPPGGQNTTGRSHSVARWAAGVFVPSRESGRSGKLRSQ
jgi:hypothetical protein